MKKQEIKINHSSLQLLYLMNESLQYSGMDFLKRCHDKNHFENYTKNISYYYNSRGFRDAEWPTEGKLKDCIWCLGDSFTVGMGQPIEETWANVLQQKTNTRTINISMDGASNTWIARKAKYILKEISPATIVIQWSYTERRESDNASLPDCKRRKHHNEKDILIDASDAKDFIKCFLDVETHKGNTDVVHTFIPRWSLPPGKYFFEDSDFMKLLFKYHGLDANDIKLTTDSAQLDWARDGHHYDIKTSSKYVAHIMKLLQL
jgi:hypothetical protein